MYGRFYECSCDEQNGASYPSHSAGSLWGCILNVNRDVILDRSSIYVRLMLRDLQEFEFDGPLVQRFTFDEGVGRTRSVRVVKILDCYVCA